MNLVDHFLIAMPTLDDPLFKKSVIYICEHSDNEGSMGIILNHKTTYGVSELIAKKNFMMADKRSYPNQVVLAGGPVNLEKTFVIHTATSKTFESSINVNENILLTRSTDIIDTLGTPFSPEKYLVALGCAAWQANQLEQEIQNNDWLYVPANEFLLFNTEVENYYHRAIELLGIQRTTLINYMGTA